MPGKEKTKIKIKNWQRQCASAYKHFRPLNSLILSLQFFLHFREKLFGGFEEKTLEPHYLFSFLFTQPNTLQKRFSSHFLSKIFYPPYFTSKQTHHKSWILASLVRTANPGWDRIHPLALFSA